MVQRVGIDLGTTFSAVSKVVDGKPVIIRNSYGKELTPSVICFFNDEVLVGEEAYEMMASGAGESVTAFKRRMGFTNPIITYNGSSYNAEQLSAILLKHLVDEASAALGSKITEAVITVPQYFDHVSRKATIDAGRACGLDVLKIINEPTSAALYYGYNYSKNKTIMVYDLGGGTFDVNVISFDNGKTEVLASKGDHFLGGKNWDEALMNLACDGFMDEFGIDPREDPKSKSVMMATAEKVKRQLSTGSSAPFLIEYKEWTGRYTITRNAFYRATEHLLITTMDICNKVLEDKKMGWDDIDEILLIGGSSRMPMVQSFLKEQTGRPVVHHPDMELAVAKGAALAASAYRNGISETVLSDVTAHSLGALSVKEGCDRYVNEIMIPKNSGIPCKFTKPFRINERNWTKVIEVYALQGESEDPDDCVIVSRSEISDFVNEGTGTVINITYNYDENGVVVITADQGGSPLKVRTTPLPDDMDWISGKPSDRKDNKETVRKSIVVCLDVSRSMRDYDPNDKVPIDEAKRSIKAFVDRFDEEENNLYSLIAFSDRSKVVCEPTPDRAAFKQAVDSVKVMSTGRGTAGKPLQEAKALAQGDGYYGVIVVLTDGVWEKKDEAIRQSSDISDAGIPIFAVGFGEVERGFLKQISTIYNGDLYTCVSDLGSTMETIATAIKTNDMRIRARD